MSARSHKKGAGKRLYSEREAVQIRKLARPDVCTAPRCRGLRHRLEHGTDGYGRTVSWCPHCGARA